MVFSEQERLERLQLLRSPRVGPITFRQLLKKFGSARKALLALPELAARGGAKNKIKPKSKAQASEEMARVDKLGGKMIFWGEENYPQNLFVLNDAPPVITVFGQAQLILKTSISIVGTRNASANGLRFAAKIAKECGEAGYVVVSGMARGVDTAANSAAIENGSVAVLAGGADNIYPYDNRKLYYSLVDRGAIVSEMPVGLAPTARHFPRRNRIIAGLALGTVIIEAAQKSGAMITARYALEQGREVFAVPGSPNDERSRGPNELIRDGAYLVAEADDIINVLNRKKNVSERLKSRHISQAEIYSKIDDVISENENKYTTNEIKRKEEDKIREQIFDLTSYEPTPIDDIIRLLKSNAPKVQSALLEMELAGRVVRAPGNCIVRCDSNKN